MPVSRVNITMNGQTSMTSVGDNELPEADRYGNNVHDVKRAYKQNIDYDGEPDTNDLNVGGRPETMIEREIREQREREKELAALRTQWFNNKSSIPEVERSSNILPGSLNGDDNHLVWNSGDRAAAANAEEVLFSADTRQYAIEEPPSAPPLPPTKSKQADINPGEKLIVRELLEQQRREEELRQHWRTMGIDLNDYHGNNEDEDDPDEVDTVDDGNREHSKMTTRTVVTDRRLATDINNSETTRSITSTTQNAHCERDMRVTSTELPPKLPSTPAPVHVPDQRKQLVFDSWSQPVGGRTTSEPIPPETPSKSLRKVLPLPDEEFDGERDDSLMAVTPTFYLPVSETLMEREMRAAREREEGLRRLRGFLMNTHDEEERRSRPALAIEVKVKSERPIRRSKSEASDKVAGRSGLDVVDSRQPAAEDLDENQFSRRFAESRLKAELQRQRERELDMRQSGLIHTISEERTGNPIRYVEVVDSTSGTTSTAPVKKQGFPVVVGSAPRGTQHVEGTPATVTERSHIDGQVPPDSYVKPSVAVGVVKSNATNTASKDVKTNAQPTTSVFATSRREIPLVLRTYSYPLATPENESVVYRTPTTSKISPEARIEEEVAEMKRREAELRVLRESLRLPSLSSVTDVSVSEDAPSVTYSTLIRTTEHRDDSSSSVYEPLTHSQQLQEDEITLVGGSRRRLTLIAEWEKISFTSSTTQ